MEHRVSLTGQNIFFVFGTLFIAIAIGFLIREFALADSIKVIILFLLSIITFLVGEYFRSREI
ncbi:MAG: hypothetical protein AABX59_03625 [Nanoarchaeota archaeon]